MAEDSKQEMSDQLLVKSTSLDYLQGPVKKATRLKYNCVSVSPKLVALGSNTGGIYLVSRSEEKLIQIAFAEKETNAVLMVQLSPNEKFVGFVSSAGTVHVLELKLETKAKPETLRSTSDLGSATVTYLYWDPASTRLYVGDDQGRVSMIPVSSNKAKNLFSVPLEVILKLDSAIVQIDKADDKLLVSTMTRCYLCNTSKQTYTQIGKKLRDGHYGACFLSQGSDTPMIYCARPGSRIWEVDYNGSVLNTHQFKQLLAIPPVSVFRPDREFPGLQEGTFPGQAVNFPKLKILSNSLILSWSPSVLYVLDPVNVKVILWSKEFSGILDVVCLCNEIFIFLQTMEVTHISILPVSEVVPLCLHAENLVAAAKLCLAFKSVLHHKHIRKKFGMAELEKIYDSLMDSELYVLGECFQAMIHEVENRVALESDSSESGRSRSSSVVSSLSAAETHVNETSKQIVSNDVCGTVASEKDTDDCSNNRVVESSRNSDSDGFMNADLHVENMVDETFESGKMETVEGEQIVNKTSGWLIEKSSKSLNTAVDKRGLKEGEVNELVKNSRVPADMYINGEVVNESSENAGTIKQDLPESSQQLSDVQDDDFEVKHSGVKRDNTSTLATIVVRDVGKKTDEIVEDFPDKISLDESSKDSGISEMQHTDKGTNDTHTEHTVGLQVQTSGRKSTSPLPGITAMETYGMFEEEIEEDDLGDLRSKTYGSRRSSLTSLSSFSSAEVTQDQLQPSTDSPRSKEPIAVAVRRKVSKKKIRKVSLEEHEVKGKGALTRRQSTGSFPVLNSRREAMLSPTGSLQEPVDESHVSVAQVTLQGQALQSEEDLHVNRDQQYLEKNPDTISISSVLSNSGEFGHSGIETLKSEEFSQSLDISPTGSPLMESWESGSQEKTGSSFPSASKAKFLKMKDRMQTKVTSKTKNLIKNIKEKNLLSKAKELAENFTQPSDSFPLGEGVYVEPLDTQTTKFDSDGKGMVTEEQSTDETDSIAQCLVDIEKLQEKTEQTQAKLQEMNILMNPKAVQMILLEWVTVLNHTFQDLHIKKYTQSNIDGVDKGIEKENTELLKANVSTKTSHANDGTNENSIQNGLNGELPRKAMESSTSVDDTHKQEDSYGASILNDNDFCYIKDPLNLKPKMFKDVCELVQACFDVGAHGDVLKYRDLKPCTSSESSKNARGNLESVDEVKGVAATMQSSNCDISNLNSNTDCDGTLIKTAHISCDKDEPSESESEKKDHSRDDVFAETVKVKHKEETVPEIEDIFKDFEDNAPDDDLLESLLFKNENKNEQVESNSKCETEKLDEIRSKNTESAETEKDMDCAMGFFVRCYFPYLSLSKVREKLLRDQHTFQTWCAFVSCLQVLVMNDSDKYGVQIGSVIDHLLETHYHGDNGSMLLGHISKLIKTSNSAAVYTCVKCHPYIQPIDVLYMCRLHCVAMETVFKQYMMMMVQQASRTLRSDTETSLYDHIEVRCVWVELLLSEEEYWNTLFGMDGKPRLFAHKHKWKNRLYIENVLSVEGTPGDAERLLEICTKFGYWRGVLRLTKQLGYTGDQLDTILHLGDLDLISSYNELGYVPNTSDEWETLFTDYMSLLSSPHYQEQSVQAGAASTITVESLSLLLVQYIGPEATLALLDRLAVPEGALSTEFYQSCLLVGMVQKHQKCVLHSMLEEVDSYLWSQRPSTLSPQMHYLVAREKDISDKDPDTNLQDRIQSLTSQLRENSSTEPFIEDPECHWGVETRINLLCLCCNIALKEPVSHEEPGVLLFRCGHGYHKLCLPERECLLCERR